MIKKRVENIVKISILIGLRQIWGWLCNLYLLSYQPYLTIKNLVVKKDKSQLFLLGITIIGPILGYGMIRIVWDKWRYGEVLRSVGPVFLATMLIEMTVVSFFLYWFYRVIRRK